VGQITSIVSLIVFFLLGFQCYRLLEGKNDFWRILFLSLPLSAVLMILGIGLVGRVTHRFDWGFWGAAGLAAVFLAYLYRKGPKEPLQFRFRLQAKDIPLLLFLVLSTIGIAWIAFKYSLHDERLVQGHPALVESMLRGVYPLYFLPFPDIPNKYHIGFDILAAVFSKALGIPGIQSVDVASVFVWVSLLLFLVVFLSELGVPRILLATALAFILFSGGLSWILPGNDANGVQIPAWQYFTVAGRWAHYNFVFYFYQHPISFGALSFCSFLHIFHRWLETKRTYAFLLACLSLGAMSLIHVMFFATLLATLGMFFGFRILFRFPDWKSEIILGLVLFFVSVGLAYALGGFFQLPSPNFSAEAAKLAWPPGYLRYENYSANLPMTAKQAVLWYLDSFGIFLVVLPLAFLRMRREKRPILWVLATYCLLSILIPQFVYYAYSSNIQKWFLGFEFSGKILCAILLLPLCLAPWKNIIAQVVTLTSMVTPVAFVYGMTLKPYKQLNGAERRIVYNQHVVPAGNLARTMDVLKSHPQDLGLIWATTGMSRLLAVNTGYPVLETDNTVAMPIARSRYDERRAQLRQLFSSPSVELLRKLQVRWTIFSCQEMTTLPAPVKDFINTLRSSNIAEDLSLTEPPSDCFVILKIQGV